MEIMHENRYKYSIDHIHIQHFPLAFVIREFLFTSTWIVHFNIARPEESWIKKKETIIKMAKTQSKFTKNFFILTFSYCLFFIWYKVSTWFFFAVQLRLLQYFLFKNFAFFSFFLFFWKMYNSMIQNYIIRMCMYTTAQWNGFK